MDPLVLTLVIILGVIVLYFIIKYNRFIVLKNRIDKLSFLPFGFS